jgi:hypothetical protein
LLGLAVSDDVIELIGDGLEGGRIRRGGRVCAKFERECLVLALERVEARIQGGYRSLKRVGSRSPVSKASW